MEISFLCSQTYQTFPLWILVFMLFLESPSLCQDSRNVHPHLFLVSYVFIFHIVSLDPPEMYSDGSGIVFPQVSCQFHSSH